VLAPFHRVHHERYAVYWRVLSPERWAQREAEVARVEQELQEALENSLDHVAAGDVASESAHAVQATNSVSGMLSGRAWRQAGQGGGFSYRLSLGEAGPDAKLVLVCVFGARDRNRAFDILVDGVEIATPELDGAAPGEVRLETYALPADLVRGRDAITVRFQAADRWDAATANVFCCALVREP
jgi:hypothetical protein